VCASPISTVLAARQPTSKAAGAQPGVPLEALTEWRGRAEPLLDESSAMRAADSPHAAHMDRMPGERKAVEDADARLDAAAIEVEYRETRLLMGAARAFAKETGGILYDAPVHGALKARADSLGARPDLPEPMRRDVAAVTGLDARWARGSGRLERGGSGAAASRTPVSRYARATGGLSNP